MSDPQLVAEYLSGDQKALEFLFSRWLGPIYAFLYRRLGNAPDAEDAAQETFVKCWRNLKKFDQTKSFKPWIFRIAHNTAVDFLRKKKMPVFSQLDSGAEEAERFEETLADPSPLPAELYERKNLAEELARAVASLAPAYRDVLFLHYNDHLTFQEIAETLDEPLNTVKSRHLRALVALKKLLRAD